jgi:hypothetical protein
MSGDGSGWKLRDEKPQYRMVACPVWRTRLRGLSPFALALHYLLTTGPNTTSIPGLLSAGEMELAGQLGMDLDAFRAAWAELVRREMVEADWELGVVWVKHTASEDPPNGPNTVKRWRTLVRTELPDCAFVRRALQGICHAVRAALASPDSFLRAFNDCFPELAEPLVVPIPVPIHEPLAEPLGYPRSLIPNPKEEEFAGPAAPAAAPPPPVSGKVQKPLGLVHEAKAKPDPRHAPLVVALTAAFEAECGEAYVFAGAKDAMAVRRLLHACADDAEIVRRFRAALVHEKDFHRVSTIAAFAAKWNEYAPRQVKRDVTKGRHRAEDSIPDEVDERGNFIEAAR